LWPQHDRKMNESLHMNMWWPLVFSQSYMNMHVPFNPYWAPHGRSLIR